MDYRYKLYRQRADKGTASGGVVVSGPVLRGMFGLRSTAASIKVGEKNVIFTTTGYGHGVGMSQYGANTLAYEGKNYREILTGYYSGVTFADEKTSLIIDYCCKTSFGDV